MQAGYMRFVTPENPKGCGALAAGNAPVRTRSNPAPPRPTCSPDNVIHVREFNREVNPPPPNSHTCACVRVSTYPLCFRRGLIQNPLVSGGEKGTPRWAERDFANILSWSERQIRPDLLKDHMCAWGRTSAA